MKQIEPKQKDKYEPPEVQDIAPVTIAEGGNGNSGVNDPGGNGDEIGWGSDF